MTDLGGLVERVAAGLARNLGAEWPFYAALGGALTVVLIAEIFQRQNLLARYGSRNVRTDLLYALLELSHLEALLVLAPVAAGLNGVIDGHAPGCSARAAR